MRLLLSLFIVFSTFFQLSAQISLNTTYFPTAGDTLRIAIDTTAVGITVSGPGGGQTWDYSALSPRQ
jgi:hypothetical protein